MFIKAHLLELQALGKLNPSVFSPKQEKCVPPGSDSIKLNFDASFSPNAKTAISRVLGRNSSGLIMVACTYPTMVLLMPSLPKHGRMSRPSSLWLS